MAEKIIKQNKKSADASERQTITKTVWQYSKPLSSETMAFLHGIATDYAKVKAYVYRRYSGIKNVNRLTPYFAILTEVRHCGLKERLNLPSAYYDAAVMEAIANIKTMWAMLKNTLRDAVWANENLTDDDRYYIRTILRINSIFAAILNRECYNMPDNSAKIIVDTHRLNNLICRLVRKYFRMPSVHNSDYFVVRATGYKYVEQSLYIASREPRKRLCLPVRDGQTSNRQLRVHLKNNYVAIALPFDMKVKEHDDYDGTIYAYIGYKDVCTLSSGRVYGRSLNTLTAPETYRIGNKVGERQKLLALCKKRQTEGHLAKAVAIKTNNLGKIKYEKRKRRERERTENFINAELNRMIKTEKPKLIVITKPVTKNKTKNYSKGLNLRLSRSFREFIRQRLAYKCREHGIELIEINSKGTGSVCSLCGEIGKREKEMFVCQNCGFSATIAENSAKNIEIIYNNTFASSKHQFEQWRYNKSLTKSKP